MADAVEAVLDDPSVRVAPWAHDGHLGRRRHGGAVPSLGQHLRSRCGDAPYALGPLFGRGAFRAADAAPFPGPSASSPFSLRNGRRSGNASHADPSAVGVGVWPCPSPPRAVGTTVGLVVSSWRGAAGCR
nr:erythromycin esterase family protein [Streptomyces litmocidini]